MFAKTSVVACRRHTHTHVFPLGGHVFAPRTHEPVMIGAGDSSWVQNWIVFNDFSAFLQTFEVGDCMCI